MGQLSVEKPKTSKGLLKREKATTNITKRRRNQEKSG